MNRESEFRPVDSMREDDSDRRTEIVSSADPSRDRRQLEALSIPVMTDW